MKKPRATANGGIGMSAANLHQGSAQSGHNPRETRQAGNTAYGLSPAITPAAQAPAPQGNPFQAASWLTPKAQ